MHQKLEIKDQTKRKPVKSAKMRTVEPLPGVAVDVPNWEIRWAQSADITNFVRIEKDCLEDNAWSISRFRDALQKSKCSAHVCCDPDTADVVGFVLHRNNQQNVEIIRLVVAAGYRRQKIGTSLVNRLHNRASKNREIVSVAVPERLLTMQLFFQSLGFRATQIVKNADPLLDDD